ncbi:metal-sensitive transcriptional regulator [Gulosibacter sp. 10]|uniref:metal-sensitive transcriptional regulator n=1 Tax=Gulosibacter sp. 10 TaxID=1255570 RepID=UPI00097F5B9B|nr:metal-sensitive transcriptional regulator [Gulosibacter sp. 10]SJM67274.1 Repressor CsoR of the copZA operon [Gulosibacter sp. 10]
MTMQPDFPMPPQDRAEPVPLEPEDGSAEGAACHQHGYREHVQPLKNRLRRIEGQVRGLERMVDEDAYCIDVITQISAAKAALDRVALILLEDHLGHCVADAAAAGDSEVSATKIQEVTDVVRRMLK